MLTCCHLLVNFKSVVLNCTVRILLLLALMDEKSVVLVFVRALLSFQVNGHARVLYVGVRIVHVLYVGVSIVRDVQQRGVFIRHTRPRRRVCSTRVTAVPLPPRKDLRQV